MSGFFDLMPPARDRGGKSYERQFDYARLNGQQRSVWHVVKDGRRRSLSEFAVAVGLVDRLFVCGPSPAGRGRFLIDRLRDRGEASASARLRDFRKMGLRIDRKRIKGGPFIYRVVLGEGAAAPETEGKDG